MAHTSEASDAMIEIKVRTMDSQTHNLRISNQRRVQNLKEEIALLIGMPTEQQRLIYCGNFLEDDQVISSCNVQHGDTLHLVRTVPDMSFSDSSSSRLGGSGRNNTIHRIIYTTVDGGQVEVPLEDEVLTPQVTQMLRGLILNDRLRLRENDASHTSVHESANEPANEDVGTSNN